MNMDAIIERIKGGTLDFKQIGGALEFAGLSSAPGRLPAGYVVPEGDTATTPQRVGIIDQRVSEEFSVVLVLAGRRAGAAATADELALFRAGVIDLLLGWTPPGFTTPIAYLGGRLLSVDGTTLVWGLRFSSAYHLRKVA